MRDTDVECVACRLPSPDDHTVVAALRVERWESARGPEFVIRVPLCEAHEGRRAYFDLDLPRST